MATVIFIVRKLTGLTQPRQESQRESSLYNVVIIISEASIKTALIDKNMLSIKNKSRDPVDYQKKAYNGI